MHDISYLRDILVLLMASVGIVVIFKQLGLSPVLGYLVAGTLIGPFGFGILENGETTKSFAELGVVFLLFAIGLELTFTKLKTMKKYVLGFGGLQFFLTAIIIALFCKIMNLGTELSIIIGSALALSSTAIVLQVINENSEQSTRVGRLSFSVLLMQDLAVIPILVLIPLMTKTDIGIGTALGGALLNAVLALAIIFIVGRLFLRPIYRVVVNAKSDVLFLSTTLLVILGAAFVSNKMGLSFALGAFIAGLMVAETEYKYRVENEILSLKSLLLGLFFMTIGMSFQFKFLLSELPSIAFVSLALILCKFIIIVLLCMLFRFPLAPAIHTGLLLAQGGEFAFVVFIMSVEEKLMSQELSQFLMTVTTVTMAFTPMLASLGRKIKGQIYIRKVLHDNKIKRELGDISKHIIIIGFGRIGRIISYVLRRQEVNYIILDNNHRVVRMQKAAGYNIYYGDPMNLDILKHIGIERAESVIVSSEDEFACMKVTRFISENFPSIPIITKTETINNISKFSKVGASTVISSNLETGLQLSRIALASMGVDNKNIDSTLEELRNIDSNFIKTIYQETDNADKI